MNRRPSSLIVVMLCLMSAAWLFRPAALYAHGVVGKRLFVEPIATEDANVFSEFDLVVPSYVKGDHENELSIGSALTLQLTSRLGLEMEGEWVSLNPDIGSNESGWANPEAVLKYVAFTSPEHEWIATVAAGAEFPYGTKRIGADDFWTLKTGFFYGKGFGDLPGRLAFLRPLMIQGDGMIHQPLTGSATEGFCTLSYDLAVYYSIPYLQQFVKDVGIPRPLNRLFPMVELNYERVLNGPDLGNLEGFARPGLLWVGRSVELGVAAVIPITEAAREKADIGVTGIVSLYLDDMFPDAFRKPLFER